MALYTKITVTDNERSVSDGCGLEYLLLVWLQQDILRYACTQGKRYQLGGEQEKMINWTGLSI
jgi:hypothetical protein